MTLPKRLVIFDLDGVVYLGDTPTPGAADVIARIHAAHLQVRYLTNNSSRSRLSYCEKLASMGIPASPEEVMTSAYATALYLRQNAIGAGGILVVGEEGLCQELEAAGISVLRAGSPEAGKPVDAVVVGIDRQFTYQKLSQAQQAILGGAHFIATNLDPTYPTEAGILPGGGSIAAAVEVSSGAKPIVIGKPNTFSLDLILKSVGATPGQAVLVGDRLDTDISVGRRAGLDTILVLTGVTSFEQARDAPPEMAPHLIIHDLRELEEQLH